MAVYKGLIDRQIKQKRTIRLFRSYMKGRMTHRDLNREMKKEGKFDIRLYP